MYVLDMLVMDLFPIYFTQNHYFCFYFLTLAFYFVPSLDNALDKAGEEANGIRRQNLKRKKELVFGHPDYHVLRP